MKNSPVAEPVSAGLKPLTRRKPTRAQAEDAVRTLLAWAGDDPLRPGLADTPRRVADAYGEYFAGYQADPLAELSEAVPNPGGYGDIVMLTDIRFESHCEHHIAPFAGVAHVAYVPGEKVVGLSKLARVVEIYARRLQTQEALTGEIAQCLMDGLGCKGAAVMLCAEHTCMSMRGVRQRGVTTLTSRFAGLFECDAALRERFLAAVHAPRPR